MPDKDTTPPDHTDLSELRAAISKVLVKWNMPTRQAAISEILVLFKQYAQPPVVADEELDEILFDYELEVSSIEKKLRKGSLIPQEAEKRIAEQQTEAKAALLQREQRLVAEAERQHRAEIHNVIQLIRDGYDIEKIYRNCLKQMNELEAQLRHNTNTGKGEDKS